MTSEEAMNSMTFAGQTVITSSGTIYRRNYACDGAIECRLAYSIQNNVWTLSSTQDPADWVRINAAVAFSIYHETNTPVAAQPPSCSHSWKTYQGFTETYDYCAKCDVKKADVHPAQLLKDAYTPVTIPYGVTTAPTSGVAILPWLAHQPFVSPPTPPPICAPPTAPSAATMPTKAQLAQMALDRVLQEAITGCDFDIAFYEYDGMVHITYTSKHTQDRVCDVFYPDGTMTTP